MTALSPLVITTAEDCQSPSSWREISIELPVAPGWLEVTNCSRRSFNSSCRKGASKGNVTGYLKLRHTLKTPANPRKFLFPPPPPLLFLLLLLANPRGELLHASRLKFLAGALLSPDSSFAMETIPASLHSILGSWRTCAKGCHKIPIHDSWQKQSWSLLISSASASERYNNVRFSE